MKKIMFTLSVLFVVLTFVGAGYVLYNAGSVNAGYAVIIKLPFAQAHSMIKRNDLLSTLFQTVQLFLGHIL